MKDNTIFSYRIYYLFGRDDDNLIRSTKLDLDENNQVLNKQKLLNWKFKKHCVHCPYLNEVIYSMEITEVENIENFGKN